LTPTETIFEHWNSKKVRGNKWKGHKVLLPHMKTAIQKALKQYGLEILKQAVDNYAKVLLGREYKWSYAWTLFEFFTRHKPEQRQELQLYRWIDFYEEDYYSEGHIKKQQHKREIERAKKDLYDHYNEFPTERLEKMKQDRYYKAYFNVIDKIIAERTIHPNTDED